MMNSASMTSLKDYCSDAYVISYKENTSQLEDALLREGFAPVRVQTDYSPRQLGFSAAYRCLINHANAWHLAKNSNRPVAIFEADFVPVRGLGSLPIPCPEDQLDNALIYLYACGPQFWDLSRSNVSRGHAGGMVAYVVSPRVAALLLVFYDEQVRANPQGAYSTWDAGIGYWLKSRNVQSYLPKRHYGEHGGLWNCEHSRIGLRRPHRAGVMQGRLAFLPAYAHGSHARYFLIRFQSYVYGLCRLLSGRLIAPHDARRMGLGSMLGFCVGRFI